MKTNGNPTVYNISSVLNNNEETMTFSLQNFEIAPTKFELVMRCGQKCEVCDGRTNLIFLNNLKIILLRHSMVPSYLLDTTTIQWYHF